MDRDLRVIFGQFLGTPLKEEFHFNIRNGEAKRNKTIQYLQQLTHETKESLYQVYKNDFEMFEYEAYSA